MAIAFQTKHFTFLTPGTQQGKATFNGTVNNSQVILQGFYASYGSTDHWLKDLKIQISNIYYSGQTVTFSLTFDLEDNSSNQGEGEIEVVIIADLL